MSTVSHTFVSAISDSAAAQAAGEVLPSHWNADHTVTPLVSDGSEVLVSKNVDADNVLNGNFTIVGGAFDVNAISGRFNQTYAIGYNVSQTGDPLLAAEPVVSLNWESFFEQGGGEWCEFHTVYNNGDGTSYRAESYAFNRADDEIHHTSLFDIYSLGNSAGNILIVHTVIGTDLLSDYNGSGSRYRVSTNNIHHFQQRNAANDGYLDLPFFDTGDRLRAESRCVFVGASPNSGTFPNEFATFQATSGVDGGALIRGYLPSITGSFRPAYFGGAITGDMELLMWNSSNTASAKTVLGLWVAGTSANDAEVDFRVVGGGEWGVGIDNSDSDRFKISSGGTLGTNDAIAINSALNVTFGKEIEFTEMTAPSAPAANGARIFCVDNGGKTELMVLFASGVAQQLAIEA